MSSNADIHVEQSLLYPDTEEQKKLRQAIGIPNHLPIYVQGKVTKGFGRGSKDLGIRTANFSKELVESLPSELETGIYYCWAQVCYDKNNSELTPPAGEKLPAKQPEHYSCTKVLPAVMSVGWNPFYNNTTKSMETHLIHDFKDDFYDAVLRVSIVGRLRGEKNYESLQDLIDDINRDIANAQEKLCDDFSNLCYPGSFFYRCCSIE